MTKLSYPMSSTLRARISILMVSAASTLYMGSASATNFNITAPSTTAQTLGSGSGQTGAVTASGSLTVSGTTVAVTVSGNNATLTNLGTINQTGTGRAIRDNTGVTGLVVNNGSLTNSMALMQAADADVFQMNKSPASVTLNNYGSMISLNASAGGSQAVDFNAVLSGSNTINNFAGGLMEAYEADAVRPGVNGTVYNAGTIRAITATGSSSDGIDAQNNSGVQITNDSTGLIEGGRHGITGGALDNTTPFTMSITNNLGGVIKGDNGSGINLDGFNALQTATIVNNGQIIGNGVTGDGDGVDVDGLVNLTNTGIIRSLNSFSSTTPAQSEGVTVGGGTIINSGTIEGLVASGNTNAVGRGITLAGIDTSGAPEPIYGNSVITNLSGGLIRGQTDSAIVVDGATSGFTVTINNNAGATLLGGSTTFAAVRSGANNDTINNAGTINGQSSGKAIDMGDGNNVLNIIGGVASIIGDITGGTTGTNTMTINAGTGNSFNYSGAISNISSLEQVSGITTFSGVSSYTGNTIVSGGTLILNGANRLSSASALNLNGGTLKVTNAGGSNGQTFASLSLSNSSTIDLDLMTSLTFNSLGSITNGNTLTVVNWSASSSPDYAFRIYGDASSNAAFYNLISGTTIDGLAAAFQFDGTYTDVKATPLPAALGLLISGLGLLGSTIRRKQTAVTACLNV